MGIHAYAPHANDPAAHAIIFNLSFFQICRFFGLHQLWWQIVWLPVLFYFWQLRRVRSALRKNPVA